MSNVISNAPFYSPSAITPESYTPPTGDVFTKCSDAGAGDASVNINMLVANSAGLNDYVSSISPSSPNYSVEVGMISYDTAGSGTNAGQARIGGRSTSGGNGVACSYTTFTGGFELIYGTAASPTSVATYTNSFGSPSVPFHRHVKILMVGNQAELRINGWYAGSGTVVPSTAGFPYFAQNTGGVNAGVGLLNYLVQPIPPASAVYRSLPSASYPALGFDEVTSASYIQIGSGSWHFAWNQTGATAGGLTFDTSKWANSPDASHQLGVWVNGVRYPNIWVPYTGTPLDICCAQGLNPTSTSYIEVMEISPVGGTNSRWDTTAGTNEFARITRIWASAGGVITPAAAPGMPYGISPTAPLMLIVADSYGEYAPFPYAANANDASFAGPRQIALTMGCRFVCLAVSGSGVVTTFTSGAGVPVYDAALTGGNNTRYGFLDQQCAYPANLKAAASILLTMLNTNDDASNAGTLGTKWAALLAADAAYWSTSKWRIYCGSYSPFNNHANTVISAQVAAYKVANPTDTKVLYVGPSPELSAQMQSFLAPGDTVHVNQGGAALIARDVAQQSRTAGVPMGTSGGGGISNIPGLSMAL